MNKAIWIESNGTETEVKPNNSKDFQLDELQGFVRGEKEKEGTIDLVSISDDRYMVVNDNGIHLMLDVNEKATKLYREIGGQSPVVGNVLVCPRKMIK